MLSEALKRRVKSQPVLNRLLVEWRAGEVDRYIAWEQRSYEDRARELGVTVPDEATVQSEVRARLAARGISGERHGRPLHVVYATTPGAWEADSIPPELAKLGRVSTFYQRDQDMSPVNPDWSSKRPRLPGLFLDWLRRLHAQAPIDALITDFCDGDWAPTIRDVCQLGIFTCVYHYDDQLKFCQQWDRRRWQGPRDIYAAYDLCWTSSPSALIKYRVEGARPIFLSQGSAPDVFKPRPGAFKYDVSFVGVAYGQRPSFIDALRRRGVNVSVFGAGWPSGAISFEDMIEVFGRSRINLGFGTISHSRKSITFKGREFDIPMCGGLVLTNEFQALHSVYDVGREVVTFTDADDCARTIHRLLGDPAEADRIREAGFQRCRRDHTWEQRFARILRLAGLLP